MAGNRQKTLFNWASLSALNNQPTVLYGLTINELLLCTGSGLVTAFFMFVLGRIFSGDANIALAIGSVSLFLNSYVFLKLMGKYKKKYGAQMYRIHLLKLLQKYGIWDSGLEINKKEWIGTRSKRF